MEYTIEEARKILRKKHIKVITISGEPVSGKSTARANLKNEYEKMGFTVKEISIGDIFREIAEKEGYRTIEDFNEALKKRGDIDRRIDEQVRNLGKRILEEGNKRTVYIIDSRMAWKNIPYAFSVRLKCDSKVAGNRLFNANRNDIDSYKTEEEAYKAADNRKKLEVERYKTRYGVDLADENNYSLVIDTSYADIKDISKTIRKCAERDRYGMDYAKNWLSPKKLIPTQNIDMSFNINHKETSESIKEKGFLPDKKILIIEVNIEGINYKFAYDGHNRMIAAANNGITLVPVEVVARDDEKVPFINQTAREYVKNEVDLSKGVYNHEDAMNIRYVPDVYEKYPDVSKILIKKAEAEVADSGEQVR